MDKIKQNEKGSNSILNTISVTLSSVLSAISSGTNGLLLDIKNGLTNIFTAIANGTNVLLGVIRDLLVGAKEGKTVCEKVTTTKKMIVGANDCKKGVIISNNQSTDVYIGFDNGVTADCFVFHLRPAENQNEPQDYIIIEKEEYYGEIWAVAKVNPSWGTVNTTCLFT